MEGLGGEHFDISLVVLQRNDKPDIVNDGASNIVQSYGDFSHSQDARKLVLYVNCLMQS